MGVSQVLIGDRQVQRYLEYGNRSFRPKVEWPEVVSPVVTSIRPMLVRRS